MVIVSFDIVCQPSAAACALSDSGSISKFNARTYAVCVPETSLPFGVTYSFTKASFIFSSKADNIATSSVFAQYICCIDEQLRGMGIKTLCDQIFIGNG